MLVSTTTRSRGLARTISSTTVSSAAADGSEVMTIEARRATSPFDRATTPPARRCAARAFGTTSWPTTRKPAFIRFDAIAEPMMPSPIMPTAFFMPSVLRG